MKIRMVPHDPAWPGLFAEEAGRIQAALGETVVTIHHIGSTAIPTIFAKPILDLLVAVRDLADLDAQEDRVIALGYEARGEFGIPGRRYFPKNDRAGERTHQIHAFADGSPQIDRHLAFRDYMIAHPEDAQAYSDLKRELAARFPEDIDSYCDGKDGFIREMDRRAAAWRAG